jgi:hypothetical protein
VVTYNPIFLATGFFLPLSLGGGIGVLGVFLTYVKVFLLRVLLGLSYY